MTPRAWWDRAARVALTVVALGGVVGCEKLSSLFGGNQDSSATASTTAAPAANAAGVPQRPPVLPADTAASINGVAVSKADVELRVQELKALMMNLGQEWKPLTEEQLGAVLDELVNNELMSQAAVARGLDRQLETQRHWEFIRRGFFAQEWLQWNQNRLDVSSAEVEQAYEQNKLGFREPERRKLRQITVASEEQAKQALAQLLSGSVQFSELAQQTSLAPSAAKGGLLDKWVMRTQEKAFVFPSEADAEAAGIMSLDPGLEAAAFAIDQVNGLSSYVKGADNRYHLFQLVERQAEKQRTLTDVWDQIKNYLLVQKLQAALEELRTQAKIERFPERLHGVTQ